MQPVTKKLVKIVTEAVLEHSLVEDIEHLGAHGYTITSARGKGSRGVRTADWDTSSNIALEVVCDESVAQAISSHLQQYYYDNYAMIIYWWDVSVLRPEKF